MYKQRHGKRGGKNYQTQTRAPRLADNSISVFRLVSGEGLASAVDCFDSTPCSAIRSSRSDALQKPPALNQLEMRETQFNKSVLGSIPVHEAIDALYQNIPSLRKKRTVGIGKVSIFGSQKASMKPVAICLDPVSSGFCTDEREKILETLEGLAPADGQEFDWLTVKTPHISIGRIHRDTPPTEVGRIIQAVESVLPETLILRNATLHHG